MSISNSISISISISLRWVSHTCPVRTCAGVDELSQVSAAWPGAGLARKSIGASEDVCRVGGVRAGEGGAKGEGGQEARLSEGRQRTPGARAQGRSLADELSNLFILESQGQGQGLHDGRHDGRHLSHDGRHLSRSASADTNSPFARVPSADSQASPPSSPRQVSPIKHDSPRESNSRSPTQRKLTMHATQQPASPSGAAGQGGSPRTHSHLRGFSSPTSPPDASAYEGVAARSGHQPATPQPRRPLLTVPYADQGPAVHGRATTSGRGSEEEEEEEEEGGIQTYESEIERAGLGDVGLEGTHGLGGGWGDVFSASMSSGAALLGAARARDAAAARARGAEAARDAQGAAGGVRDAHAARASSGWEASRFLDLDSARDRISRRIDAAALLSTSALAASHTAELEASSSPALRTNAFSRLVLVRVF